MHIKFLKKLIQKRKNRNSLKKIMKQNTLYLPEGINYEKLRIKIKGENNIIKIAKGLTIGNLLEIRGWLDNSVIEIGENFTCGSVVFQLGQDHKNFGKVKNVSIRIGANTSWGQGQLVSYNSNSYVKIGNECMFASNVTIYNTDSHPIFKEGTTEIINKVKGIEVGNHVWLGMNATVLKNSIVPNDSVVAWGSIFSGDGGVEHCIYAGIPSKCVKKNIDWNANGSKFGYIENIS